MSIWANKKKLENLFKVENHNDISVLKFSNIAIVYGTFKNIRFNESTHISIPVIFKSASIAAVPWHTGTPGNLTIMAYVQSNKVIIRVNNINTGLQNVSGTFIVVGTI